MMPDTSTTARPADAVPGPAGGLRVLRAMASGAPQFFAALRDEFGPVVRIPLAGTPAFLVNDPAAIQDVLVTSSRAFGNDILRGGADGRRVAPLALLLGQGLLTSDGELHRRQRRLIQPLFHRQRVDSYAAAFAQLSERHAAGWVDGARVDMHQEMVALTLAVVTRTIFDVSLTGGVATAIRTALPRNDGPLQYALIPGGRLLARLPLPSNVKFRRGRRVLDTVVYRLIAERRATGTAGRTDLLSLLLDARDADTGEPMDDREVRDEVLTLLMAGHDTTANALAWAFHLLSGDAEARERLYAEVDQVLGDRLPGAADLPRLTWTNAVLAEALRIYPPVWTVGRRPLREHPVCGYRLPANSMVMMSPWVVHRDPRWWPQPERFAPQRWLPAAAGDGDGLTGTALDADRPRFAYFPFGGGPRQCIGNQFALTEGVLALATLSRHWHVRPASSRPVVPRAKIIVRPRSGLPMTVHRR